MAFSADVRATPTYLVNGVNVDPGTDGKALSDYVEKALKAPAIQVEKPLQNPAGRPQISYCS